MTDPLEEWLSRVEETHKDYLRPALSMHVYAEACRLALPAALKIVRRQHEALKSAHEFVFGFHDLGPARKLREDLEKALSDVERIVKGEA